MWWGPNPRAIVLMSPKTQKLVLRFNAISLSNSNATDLGVYLGTTKVTQVPIYGREAIYSINITAPSGYSEVAFYSTEPQTAPGQYASFGISNITFSSK